MKLLLSIIAPLIFLTGCLQTAPKVPEEKLEPKVVVRTEYVLRIPPVELLTAPAQVPDIDTDTALQSDIARWLNAKEDRMSEFESKFREIGIFLRDEQTQLDNDAKAKDRKQ